MAADQLDADGKATSKKDSKENGLDVGAKLEYFSFDLRPCLRKSCSLRAAQPDAVVCKRYLLDVGRDVWTRVWDQREIPKADVPEVLFVVLPNCEGTEKLEGVVGIQHSQGFVVDLFACAEYGWVNEGLRCMAVRLAVLSCAEREPQAAVPDE